MQDYKKKMPIYEKKQDKFIKKFISKKKAGYKERVIAY